MSTISPLNSFLSAPPISRTLAVVVFTFSILLYTGALPLNRFDLALEPLIKWPVPEIWRISTSFLITGGGLGILFDTYFLYVYGAKLESATPRFTQQADFIAYIYFCRVIILLLNLTLTSGSALASPLALSFITTSTLTTYGTPLGLALSFLPPSISIPPQYLPYGLLFLTCILVSPQAATVQGTGVVAAHFYELLSGSYAWSGISKNWIQVMTPSWGRKVAVVREGVLGSEERNRGWKFGRGRALGQDGGRGGLSAGVRAGLIFGGFLLVCGGLGLLYLRGGAEGWFKGWKDGWGKVFSV